MAGHPGLAGRTRLVCGRDRVPRTVVGSVLARTYLAGKPGGTRVTQAGPHNRLAALATARGQATLRHSFPDPMRSARTEMAARDHGSSALYQRACAAVPHVNGPPLAGRSSAQGFRRNQRNRLLSGQVNALCHTGGATRRMGWGLCRSGLHTVGSPRETGGLQRSRPRFLKHAPERCNDVI
jgi:hypothetical protein